MRWVCGFQSELVSIMPFSSVTTTCHSPVVWLVTRKGTHAMRAMESSSALTAERSPRMTCSSRGESVQSAIAPCSETEKVLDQEELSR